MCRREQRAAAAVMKVALVTTVAGSGAMLAAVMAEVARAAVLVVQAVRLVAVRAAQAAATVARKARTRGHCSSFGIALQGLTGL